MRAVGKQLADVELFSDASSSQKCGDHSFFNQHAWSSNAAKNQIVEKELILVVLAAAM